MFESFRVRCCGVIMKQKFIFDTQYTGLYGLMQMLDNTVRRVPMATVYVVSPYLRVEVSALCPPDAVCDVVVGNVPGTRAPDNHDPEWYMTNVVSKRSSAKRVGDANACQRTTIRKLVRDQPMQDCGNVR